MRLGQHGILIYGLLMIFGDKIANLGPIDFKIGLYIKVNVNARQNKFEVHISKHLDKVAINWQKISKMPLWRVNIKWLYARFLCSQPLGQARARR